MPQESEKHSNHYCYKCKGTGICQNCKLYPSFWDNSGGVSCIECDAKKICPRCSGSGQLNLLN